MERLLGSQFKWCCPAVLSELELDECLLSAELAPQHQPGPHEQRGTGCRHILAEYLAPLSANRELHYHNDRNTS